MDKLTSAAHDLGKTIIEILGLRKGDTYEVLADKECPHEILVRKLLEDGRRCECNFQAQVHRILSPKTIESAQRGEAENAD